MLRDWGFEVTRRDGLRIDQVHARPHQPQASAAD